MQTPTPHRALRVLLALLLLSAAANPAFALFGSSTRRMLRDADEAMERGRKAETEQRILEALDAYSRANELYREVQSERPGYRSEYVATRDAESRARVQILFARASAGQVTAPPPESVLPPLDPAQGRHRDAEAEIPADDADTEYATQPEPVRPFPRPTIPPPPAETRGRLATRERVLGVDRGRAPAPRTVGVETPARPQRTADEAPDVTLGVEARPASAPPSDGLAPPSDGLAPPSDAELARRVQRLLREGSGADAVMLMESVVEEAGEQASLAQRLLFAQALLDRRNYSRAEGVLRPLLESHRDDPGVLMMMAGVHMARGRPVGALRLLDELVRFFPRHADAYVNLAYVRFAMDPEQHRDEAILYYRHALVLGAERDPRLELELRVDVLR